MGERSFGSCVCRCEWAERSCEVREKALVRKSGEEVGK